MQLKVLDLGAGTGLGTRTIAAAGHDVLAVDPAGDMLATLASATALLPADVAGRITARRGAAESLPLTYGSVEAVTCLQAWQWVDHYRAAAECARVLVPGGNIGLAWHTWDRSAPWVQELAQVVGRAETSGTIDASGASEPPPRGLPGFGTVENRRFGLDYELTPRQLVELAGSWQYVAERTDRSRVLEQVGVLGRRAAARATGTLIFPHITDCYRARRSGAGPQPLP